MPPERGAVPDVLDDRFPCRQGERAFGDKELNLIYGELLWEAGQVRTCVNPIAVSPTHLTVTLGHAAARGQHEAATGRLVSAEEPSVIASKAMEALSSSPEQAQVGKSSSTLPSSIIMCLGH